MPCISSRLLISSGFQVHLDFSQKSFNEIKDLEQEEIEGTRRHQKECNIQNSYLNRK